MLLREPLDGAGKRSPGWSCRDLHVDDDDLAVGGDQYRHDYDPTSDCRALGARSRAERWSVADDIGRLFVLT